GVMQFRCVQQIGWKRGVRQVFDFDKVYRVDGEKRIDLGIIGHADTSGFHPRIKLTEDEKKAVIVAINAHRAEHGRKPIEGMTPPAKTIGEMKQLIGEVAAQTEEDDDE